MTRFFCGHSATWGGGYASVQRCAGGITHGHVVELSDAEFVLMDGFERGYTRKKVTVTMQRSGRTAQAWVYISDDTAFQQPASQAYLTAIHVMLREHWSGAITIDQRRVAAGGTLEASAVPHYNPTQRHVSRAPPPLSAHSTRAPLDAPRLLLPRTRCRNR